MKHAHLIWLATVMLCLGTRQVLLAQTRASKKGVPDTMSEKVHLLIPETMPKSVGYSQLAIVTGVNIVFISGQVALDKTGAIVGKDDFRAQTQQVFENLKAALEAAGRELRGRDQAEQLLCRYVARS